MKILFFATNSYPYGKGEPLIPNQINFLSKEFDKIIIVSSNPDTRATYKLPQNVVSYIVPFNLTRFQKIIGILNFFSKNVRIERQFAKETYKIKNSFSILKVILNSYSICLRFKKFYLKIIAEQELEDEELYFHSYWCTEAVTGFTLLKKKYPQAKMYSRVHAYDLYLERHNPPYLPFRKQIIENLDKFFFISDQGKKYFKELYFNVVDEKKLIVNRLGVSPIIESDSKFESVLRNQIKIVSCSSLIELKRIDLMIDSLGLIDDIQIEWTHFGDGPLLEKYKELGKQKLGVKKNIQFNFYGYIENANLLDYYNTNHVDLFLNTSQYEGVPISIMEAMAFKIPCIATNVGGVSEIISHSNGYLLPVNFNVEELKNIIVEHSKLALENIEKKRESAFDTWRDLYNGKKNYKDLISEMITPSQECSRCLYDTNDYPVINFDKKGVCEICHIYDDLQQKTVFNDEAGKQKLFELLAEIKKEGDNKDYNCLLGVSGGVDSSYLAYLSKEWGLKPLILHVDNGWNSELASRNIENILKVLDYNLYTHVIDWEEMRDMQLAFFKASVVDIDLPFDNAFMAILYQIARKFKIKYILSGHNTVTEGWMPSNFTHYKLDTINLKSIHKEFGTIKTKSFPTIGPLKVWFYNKFHKIKFISPLDYIEYNKTEVKKKLMEELNWRDYGGKHYENIFTKFYQGYILPEKFKVDKRKSHLSTLICSGQASKEEALKELEKPAYKPDELCGDKEFFIKKMELTEREFEEIMSRPIRKHTHYSSYITVINTLRKVKRMIISR